MPGSWWEANRKKILADILAGAGSWDRTSSGSGSSAGSTRSTPLRQGGDTKMPFDFSEILKNMKSVTFK